MLDFTNLILDLTDVLHSLRTQQPLRALQQLQNILLDLEQCLPGDPRCAAVGCPGRHAGCVILAAGGDCCLWSGVPEVNHA